MNGDVNNNVFIGSQYGANTMDGGDGADNLTGCDQADTLGGGNGNDTLTGGLGADTLTGGRGDDTYYVDNAGDAVVERYGQGMDTVHATVSYSLALGSYVENLVLDGSGDINGTGNSQATLLTGNRGMTTLEGGSGNATLDGGAGDEHLIGGKGGAKF